MTKVYFKPSSDFSFLAHQVFEEQKLRINKSLPYADVQHIGATSIPNSLTKGDLDIVIRVPAENFRSAIKTLKAIYKVNQPDNWSKTFASFKDIRNLGINFGAQLVIENSQSDDFIKLRDILKNNSKLIQEYNAMKLKYEGKEMRTYQKAKAVFFQKIRDKA